jgi:hypothetical protein
MKNLIALIVFSGLTCTLSSCEGLFGDFLDKAPSVDVVEDDIFKSQAQVETFVAGIYRYGMHTGAPGFDNNLMSRMDGWEDGATDEGESVADWFWTNAWNNAEAPSPSRTLDYRFAVRWTCLRMCYTLLNRIDEVPDIDPGFLQHTKGEAKFMIAMQYYEMFKFYGGVPIVEKKFDVNDDLKVPRATVAETVNFIVKNCDEAIALLPDQYPSSMRGHATKGAALALKSRTLLYAASPTFNTATPYLDFGSNNNLIIYGDYDVNRWQVAADAAKAVLDWAPSGGVHLITDQGVNKNYQYVWETHDNAEQILAEKLEDGGQNWWYTLACPPNIYSGLGGMTVPFNFIRMYEKADGTPQTWSETGGDDLMQKYSELDPMFAQTIAFNLSYLNSDFPDLQIYDGGTHYNKCKGGAWVHKNLLSEYTFNNRLVFENWVVFRLGEFYLNYAEALNEAVGPVQQAYDAVNTIRSRSGMPDFPPGLTQEEFRARIRNERTIELAYVEHRLWDLRRWEAARDDGKMHGQVWGIRITPIPNSSEYHYEPYVFESRTFPTRFYRHPFEINEISKGYLVQNPGY